MHDCVRYPAPTGKDVGYACIVKVILMVLVRKLLLSEAKLVVPERIIDFIVRMLCPRVHPNQMRNFRSPLQAIAACHLPANDPVPQLRGPLLRAYYEKLQRYREELMELRLGRALDRDGYVAIDHQRYILETIRNATTADLERRTEAKREGRHKERKRRAQEEEEKEQ